MLTSRPATFALGFVTAFFLPSVLHRVLSVFSVEGPSFGWFAATYAAVVPTVALLLWRTKPVARPFAAGLCSGLIGLVILVVMFIKVMSNFDAVG